MSPTPKTDDARIRLSRTVLTAYQVNGHPGGRIEDTMRLIGDELEILAAFRIDYPERDDIGDLIREWEELRAAVRQGAN